MRAAWLSADRRAGLQTIREHSDRSDSRRRATVFCWGSEPRERWPPSRSRARFILEPETDLLQAGQRGLTVFILDLLGQARCIGDGVNLLVGFRHDHDQQATHFVGDVAEAAVLSARHGDHVERLQHERVLASIAPGDLETAREAEKVLDRIEMAVQDGSVAGLALGNADDQATRALDRRPRAATLVIR